MEEKVINTGLRGITIASTKISDVDGAAGKLVYRGYLAKDLAGKVSFEETVYLLLYEELPGKTELAAFKERLATERTIPNALIAFLEASPKDALPMDILQASVSVLAQYDPDLKDASRDGTARMALRLIAKFATIVAAWDRIRNHLEPIPPDPSLSHAANFLYMLNGTVPDDTLAGYFDTCLVLHAEHSFNASTFTARVVASTLSTCYCSISAAIGSLSIPALPDHPYFSVAVL